MHLLLLLLAELVLVVTNYKPGTFLLGWDSLFSEMNFRANFVRNLFAVWQEYRGLGLLDGMAHAANLGQTLFVFLASLVLPTDTLRYFFVFLMHSCGGLGMYLLLEKELVKNKPAALVGALFYLFNLATVQMFYAPLELFTVHFAFLPWLVWFILRYLRTGILKDLIIFSLLSLAAVPQAHVPTVFLIYIAAVAIILAFARNFRRAAVIFITIFAINSFWLLPYGYGLLRGGAGTIIDAKINQMSSADIYANQKFRGDLADVLTLKGFMLDTNESGVLIMGQWRDYLDTGPFKAAETVFLGLAVIGVVSILRQRQKAAYPFLAVAFLAFFFLASGTPVFGFLNDQLRNNISLIGEGFRFSFTKFAIIFVFAYSVFLAYGVRTLFKGRVYALILIAFLAIYSFPVWTGNFFFDDVRVQIPADYFQTVNYFNQQPVAARIALWPQPSFWSWRFTDFKYRGSGFLWYGIPQATMDLAFDPWSREDENYYWEVSYALYSKNLPLLENVLEKYRVNWLLVDGNIINPSSPKALYTDELAGLVSQSPRFSLKQTFGKIKVYSFALQTPTNDFISLTQNLPNILPAYKWSNLDQARVDFGDYFSDPQFEASAVYAYRTLFTGRSRADLEFNPQALVDSGQGIGRSLIEILPNKVLTSANGVTTSLSWNYPGLSHRQGYLITVQAKNIQGKSLLFWVEDLNSRRANLETYLPVSSDQLTSYYVLPPYEPDGLGYTFHVDNISVGNDAPINEIDSINIWPIDYWSSVTRHSSSVPVTNTRMTNDFVVEHPNPALYRIDLNSQPNQTLILAQSFDPGWVGLGINNVGDMGVLGSHILVNNWANGWQMTGQERIVYLFYWPQLLEFAGFGLVIGVLTILATRLIIRSA